MDEKWIAIVGSPRKTGNTDLLVNYVIESLNDKNIYVQKYHLESRNISTCSGCEQCLETGNCYINDQVTEIIIKMKDADGYILASPSHNYNMSAQMKSFLDRTFCLNDYINGWESRLPSGKKAIIIGVCAGSGEESLGYTIEGMSKTLSELGVLIIDEIKYLDTKNYPVEDNNYIRETIFERIKKYERNPIDIVAFSQSKILQSKSPRPKTVTSQISNSNFYDGIFNESYKKK